jgi:hypothetical protein
MDVPKDVVKEDGENHENPLDNEIGEHRIADMLLSLEKERNKRLVNNISKN